MLIIEINPGSDNIDKALKKYKKKYELTRVLKKLKERKEYIKPSEKRRSEILKAVYINKKYGGKA